MVDYGNAIKRPFTDFKKLIIGCALTIVPIINLFASGYSLNCAKTAMAKKKELPKWDNWGDLFVRGLLCLIIGIIYFIPTLILLLITLGAGLTTALATKNILATLSAAGPLMILTIIIGILTLYLLPNACISYVSNWKFGEAFNLGQVFKKSLRGNYLIAWILVMIVSTVITAILSLIPFIGWAIGNFISMVIAFTIFGEVFTEK